MNNFFGYHGTSLYWGSTLGEKVNEGVFVCVCVGGGGLGWGTSFWHWMLLEIASNSFFVSQ